MGSAGFIFALMMFSLSSEYYQFCLSFSLVGGISCSMIFTPATVVVGQWFKEHRALALGISCTGGGFGGCIFPLVIRSLIPKVGFGWAIRIVGFIILVLATLSVICMQTRLKSEPGKSAMIDLGMFKDKLFATTAFGNFMIELALQIPATYVVSYCTSKGFSEEFGYIAIAVLNAGSIFGRFIPGYFADKYGAFNLLVVTVGLSSIFTLGIWLPLSIIDAQNKGGLITFLVLFGFSSGTGISLVPVCFSQVCDIRDYGKTYGTAYTLASIATLIGTPIAGAILNSMDNNYAGLVGFCGACYFVAGFLLIFARAFGGGFKLKVVY